MNIAVIGAGNWGRNLVRGFARLGALGAIVESDPKRRGELAAEYPEVRILERAEDLLGMKGITAAAIATPAGAHFAVAKWAMENGLDAFVEKPLTIDLNEANELNRLARERSRVLMVGHLLVYQPAIRWIASQLSEGTLGKLYSLHLERLNLGRVRSVENALWSLGVHDVAVLLSLLGKEPTRVRAVGQCALQAAVEDDVYVHLDFSDGVSAHLHTSWLWPIRSRKLTVIAERGMLVFDELERTVTLHRKRVEPSLAHIDEGEEVVFRQTEEPLQLELSHFLARLADRQAPLSDGNNGVAVIRVLARASQQMAAAGEVWSDPPRTSGSAVEHDGLIRPRLN